MVCRHRSTVGPETARAPRSRLREPPYLDMLAETHYIALLGPFDSAASDAIEALIDRHIDAILPRQRVQRFRDALLQMGYLADLSGRPTLCTLVMTAAWALGQIGDAIEFAACDQPIDQRVRLARKAVAQDIDRRRRQDTRQHRAGAGV